MKKLISIFLAILLNPSIGCPIADQFETEQDSTVRSRAVVIDPSRDLGNWEGWGSSLAWWARAVGGTANADYYADLIYSTKPVGAYPGLGLNIARYNVGGGGISQAAENKGPKLQWQMDIHGYWTAPKSPDPASGSWDWSVNSNQRRMLTKAQERGADVFELFSNSPMWWMNRNHSTAGSDAGGNCLAPAEYSRFAHYLATVARYARDHWGINFRSVEAFNEPSADWWKYPGRQEGCHFDVPTQEAIVQGLRKALDGVQLGDVAVTAADENDVEVALNTWRSYDSATRTAVGKVNVHGYYRGTESYRGPDRPMLRQEIGGKRLWQSEHGDSDSSGYTMANSIIRDVRGFKPSAWVYWQAVEPEGRDDGWGLVNAKYVDTGDRTKVDIDTPLVRVNRKFYVYGQFTRYLRAGFHMIDIPEENSIAGYDSVSHKLVVITVTGNDPTRIEYDLSRFSMVGNTMREIVTTTAPGNGIPDWQQHAEAIALTNASKNSFSSHLYPKSVYTFLVENVSP